MSANTPSCLIILAGGQSQRMGREKATIDFRGQRLVDRLIERFKAESDYVFLSAGQDYGTGVSIIADDPETPPGPVGAIFSIADYLSRNHSEITNFCTIPVDAPFAPVDLISRLAASGECTVVSSGGRLQPTFAFWQCDIVNAVRRPYEPGSKAPSLHWLVDQCGSKVIAWPDERPFVNINTPDDLSNAEQ